MIYIILALSFFAIFSIASGATLFSDYKYEIGTSKWKDHCNLFGPLLLQVYGIVTAAIVVALIVIELNPDKLKPTAIDVYRNNTELKVTYEVVGQDTLSCDSTVIFKKIK